jgi:lysophospholipase L1-like esterase
MRTLMAFGADESPRRPRGARWPGVLASDFGPGYDVVAEGLPGRTTVHPDAVQGPAMAGLAVVDALLHSHRPLDIVVIMLGTNDLEARLHFSVRDVAEGCGRLLRVVSASDAGPAGGAPAALLVCPPFIAETGWSAGMFAGGARTSRAFAGHMAQVAAASGAAFFDAGSVIASDPQHPLRARRSPQARRRARRGGAGGAPVMTGRRRCSRESIRG